MKGLICASTLVVMSLISACDNTKTETVSAASINQLPAGQSLEVDLTRTGTIYKIADDADASRITVRTSTGVRPFAELLRVSNAPARGLVLGSTNDMKDRLPIGDGSGTAAYDCGVVCKCDGTADCVGMIAAGKCTDEIWCSSTTSACFCMAKQ